MPSPHTFSFELGPPRTPEAAANLPAVIARLAELNPDYFSVTYGAGGSTQEGTYETIMSVIRLTGIEAAPHLKRIAT